MVHQVVQGHLAGFRLEDLRQREEEQMAINQLEELDLEHLQLEPPQQLEEFCLANNPPEDLDQQALDHQELQAADHLETPG